MARRTTTARRRGVPSLSLPRNVPEGARGVMVLVSKRMRRPRPMSVPEIKRFRRALRRWLEEQQFTDEVEDAGSFCGLLSAYCTPRAVRKIAARRDLVVGVSSTPVVTVSPRWDILLDALAPRVQIRATR